ncbi:MAG: hypothetical protein Q9211_003339 [Gyalolechia sp. 1 TL-2023]
MVLQPSGQSDKSGIPTCLVEDLLQPFGQSDKSGTPSAISYKTSYSPEGTPSENLTVSPRLGPFEPAIVLDKIKPATPTPSPPNSPDLFVTPKNLRQCEALHKELNRLDESSELLTKFRKGCLAIARVGDLWGKREKAGQEAKQRRLARKKAKRNVLQAGSVLSFAQGRAMNAQRADWEAAQDEDRAKRELARWKILWKLWGSQLSEEEIRA